MPSNWKRTPEQLHKTYIANTEAFYKIAGRSIAPQLDDFMHSCACQLWSHSAGITQNHVDTLKQLHSKGETAPNWLLWELTEKVCNAGDFMPPLFFFHLAEADHRRNTDTSRVFIRMFTNILLSLAAVDDDVSIAEARYITDCCDQLTAVCDANHVKKSKSALRALDYVTTGEPSFLDKYPPAGAGSAQGPGQPNAEKNTGSNAEQNPEKAPEKPDFDTLMAQLDELVGLEDIKKDVKSLMNLMKVRQLRRDAGLPVPDMSLHLVFMGNPGTGKTTVARILAGLYAAIGVLSKGQLIEVDRSGLVAGYVGQTALKTQEVIGQAMGGVLFIDEAYALSSHHDNDFGQEAIDTILKAMEDHRDDLIVIVAGYTEPMDKFMSSNPGLASRFNKYFYFEDYNGTQLMHIFDRLCEKNGYTLSPEARSYAEQHFTDMYAGRDDNFGNGRDVRNFFEDMVVRQADRVSQLTSPDRDTLMQIHPSDMHDHALPDVHASPDNLENNNSDNNNLNNNLNEETEPVQEGV